MKTVEDFKKVDFESLSTVDVKKLALTIKENMSPEDILTCVEWVLDEAETPHHICMNDEIYFKSHKPRNSDVFLLMFEDEAKKIWNNTENE